MSQAAAYMEYVLGSFFLSSGGRENERSAAHWASLPAGKGAIRTLEKLKRDRSPGLDGYCVGQSGEGKTKGGEAEKGPERRMQI